MRWFAQCLGFPTARSARVPGPQVSGTWAQRAGMEDEWTASTNLTTDEPRMAPAVALDPSEWAFTVDFDATPLTVGVWYGLCLDLDGDAPEYFYGNSGVEVFISPITYVSPAVRVFSADTGRYIRPTQPPGLECN